MSHDATNHDTTDHAVRGTMKEILEASQAEWDRVGPEVQSRYDHVHADGFCVKSLHAPRCDGASAKHRAATGTLYLDYEGNAYRLRNYSVGLDDGKTCTAHYSVSLVSGGSSSASVLPAGAREVWRPRS